MAMESINPATGETVARFDAHDEAGVERALDAAQAAFRDWRRISVSERATLLGRIADALDASREDLARMAVLEMGKPIGAARDEVGKCAWVCRYYAETAAEHLADEPAESDASSAFVAYQPLGIVLAVMPWNFPYWQTFRFAAPALAAGNACLLKHASNVPQCAMAIERVMKEAGLPDGIFTTLLVGSDRVGDLIGDARIAAVTLTGSDAAGAKVAEAAGRNIKKCVLELGGSDPFIVMPSADIEAAAEAAVKSRLVNNGQSCIAAKRFIVASDVYEDFAARFKQGMEAVRVGDPMDEEAELGPLASRDIRDEVARQVSESVEAGARVLTGGQRLGSRGFFFAPTILADIPETAPAAREEVFGPVAGLFAVEDAEAAIRLANDVSYGLASSVWTQDAAERDRFVADIAAGSVFVNRMVASDPRLPFGGIKRSGYGRELGRHGIREFVNVKTVAMD